MTMHLALASAAGTGDPFAAVRWIDGLLFGPLGTGLAIIAVGWFGFSLLAGRLPLRRGGVLVLGCFILFGAPTIAQALAGLAWQTSAGTAAVSQAQISVPPPAVPPTPPAYDPYAGAAVPN
jgi:type IV secretion system protein VirB2